MFVLTAPEIRTSPVRRAGLQRDPDEAAQRDACSPRVIEPWISADT